ncbi:MAG: hypothetical protein D3910_27525 [Candidatus Electrothrix sp. ATG2]|nr:hypothetical protein [Candidatus Electrothrix sp. ATG2]
MTVFFYHPALFNSPKISVIGKKKMNSTSLQKRAGLRKVDTATQDMDFIPSPFFNFHFAQITPSDIILDMIAAQGYSIRTVNTILTFPKHSLRYIT